MTLRSLVGVVVVISALLGRPVTGIAAGEARWTAGPAVGSLDLFGVGFAGPGVAWAVGDMDPGGSGGALYKTVDGGLDWRPGRRQSEVLASVCCVRRGTGFVAGYSGRIDRTDDGGARWRTLRAERNAEVLNSVFFVDAQHGWVVGAGGLVLRTVDGARWEVVAS